MTRLFLRFYLGILATFLVTMVVVLVWLLRETPEDAEVVESSMQGTVALLVERLEGLGEAERARELIALRNKFGFGIAVVSADSPGLPSGTADRLGAVGQPFFRVDHVYAPLNEGRLLVLGPLPDFQLPSGSLPVAALVVTAWALATLLLLWPILRATNRFESAATRMASGDLSTRVVPDRGALTHLARSFNTMAAKTETLVNNQRELLAAVSHEFRTPIARLRFACEMTTRASEASERSHLMKGMETDLNELDQLVGELLDFIRLGGESSLPTTEVVIVANVLSELITRNEVPKVRVRLLADSASGTKVAANPRLFSRAIENLLANAQRYCKGEVVVEIDTGESTCVWIRVCDDGSGIEESDRERVLRPFTTLDRTPGRTGLGLAITKRIVERHGGEIVIDDSESGGARVSTSWPIAKDHSSS